MLLTHQALRAPIEPKLHHIGVGRPHRGKRIIVLIADLDLRVISIEGELLRRLTLDPTKIYQRL